MGWTECYESPIGYVTSCLLECQPAIRSADIYIEMLLSQVIVWQTPAIKRYMPPKYLSIMYLLPRVPLEWRHNGRDGVSNHRPHQCLLNRLFSHRSNKTSKLRVTGLFVGNWIPRPKWPVTRKMFPFDDVIMQGWSLVNYRFSDAQWWFLLTNRHSVDHVKWTSILQSFRLAITFPVMICE